MPFPQKVNIYIEYHSVCPRVGIGTPLPHLPPASEHLPPEQKGGGHSPVGEGVGESQFRRLKKKLSTRSTQCFPQWRVPLHDSFYCSYSLFGCTYRIDGKTSGYLLLTLWLSMQTLQLWVFGLNPSIPRHTYTVVEILVAGNRPQNKKKKSREHRSQIPQPASHKFTGVAAW